MHKQQCNDNWSFIRLSPTVLNHSWSTSCFGVVNLTLDTRQCSGSVGWENPPSKDLQISQVNQLFQLFGEIKYFLLQDASKTCVLHFVGLFLCRMFRTFPKEWSKVRSTNCSIYVNKVRCPPSLFSDPQIISICLSPIISSQRNQQMALLKFYSKDIFLHFRSVFNPVIEPWWCRITRGERDFLHRLVGLGPLNEKGPCTVPSGKYKIIIIQVQV